MAASGSNQNRDKGPFSISLCQRDDPSAKPWQILVAEDSSADAFLIREASEQAAFCADLHFVQNGAQAMQFIDIAERGESTFYLDLVLLDLNLPKKSGVEVLRHIRNSTRCRSAAVLVVTSSDSARDREQVEALGADGYFRKPSDYAEFMKLGMIVRDILQQRGPNHGGRVSGATE